MSKSKRWLDIAQLVLIVLGIGVAGYLTYVKLFGLEPYCVGAGDCEAVQTSPYSAIFGIPVAVLGLLTYLALAVLWWVKRKDWRDLGGLATQLFFLATLVGFLFSLYLTYLELFVILAICSWCVTSAVVMTILFALSIYETFFQDRETEDEGAA